MQQHFEIISNLPSGGSGSGVPFHVHGHGFSECIHGSKVRISLLIGISDTKQSTMYEKMKILLLSLTHINTVTALMTLFSSVSNSLHFLVPISKNKFPLLMRAYLLFSEMAAHPSCHETCLRPRFIFRLLAP